MIVHKLWTTEKKGNWNRFVHEGRYYSIRETHWEGYFLLGFIPLFVRARIMYYRS